MSTQVQRSPEGLGLTALFDQGTFVELDRLALDAGRPVGVTTGYGFIDGRPAYAFMQDRGIDAGGVGRAQAAKITRVYELAQQNGAPLIGVFDSDGVKLLEHLEAMDAVARILFASSRLSGVVPQIAVVAGACVGSAALVAANMDVVVAVEGADVYLDRQESGRLPVLEEKTLVDAFGKVRTLLSLLPANNLACPPAFEPLPPRLSVPSETADVLEAVADAQSLTWLPLGEACRAALARVEGMACGLLTLCGAPMTAVDAERAASLIRLCDGFSLPVVTFIDAAGFADIRCAARLARTYAGTTSVKIAVITGAAVGAAYIAAAGKEAGADVVLAWPQAVIAPLSPAAAVEILWPERVEQTNGPADREALAQEYAKSECSAEKAAAGGHLTDVIAPEQTREKVADFLRMLMDKKVSLPAKKHTNLPF